MNLFLKISAGISALCLLGSIVALLFGIGKVEEGRPLRFDPEPFVVPFGPDWSGERDFDVAVINDSGQLAQIIGTQNYCDAACFSGAGLPTAIPAWGRGRVTLHIKTNRPGPFANEVVFFTDQPSQPRLTMRVVGITPEIAILGASTHAASP